MLIHGNNASGKTSILEAISLFSPGSGIFNHSMDELVAFGENAFEIYLTSEQSSSSRFKMQLTYIKQPEEKKFFLNETHKKQLELPEFIHIYGLTPYLAFAFWKDSSVRRKHIDRLVMQNDPRYAKLCAKYAKAMKERNKLIELNKLSSLSFNDACDRIYTPVIIETGLEITRIRKQVFERLNTNMHHAIEEFLGSKLLITMSPTLEEQEKIFTQKLDHYFMGPHKTKFTLSTTQFDGAYASTGQQKKLLLALTIAALPEGDAANILLLDDLFANLDEQTIEHLLHTLDAQHFQTWITNINDIKTNLNMQRLHLQD